jgi:hypothetical protein
VTDDFRDPQPNAGDGQLTYFADHFVAIVD